MEGLLKLRELVEDNKFKSEIIINLIYEGVLGSFEDAIDKSSRIFLYGAGNESSMVCKELKNVLTRFGKYVFDIYEYYEMENVLKIINEDDCIVLIDVESSKDYLYKIDKMLDKKGISRFFIGLEKESRVPICTHDFSRIYSGYKDIHWDLELYSMLIRFLYEILNNFKADKMRQRS